MDKLLQIINNNQVKNITDVLFLFETKYNKIIFMENSVIIDNKTDREIQLNSKNNYLYYFNKIRIYYLNYIKSKKIFIDNNNLLKKDVLSFIKTNNIGTTEIKQPKSKINNIGRTRTSINLDSKNKSKFEDISENRNKSQNSNSQNSNSGKKSKSFFEKFINNFDKIVNKIHFVENKFFRKLCKRISIYTHPDKTNDKFLNYLFLESRKSLENNHYFLLILISVILGITHFKLHNNEKTLLNKDIDKMINYRRQFIKNIVFNYDKLNKKQKNNVVINCIKNNIFNVKYKETF